jgi:hypothetical protein
MRSRLAAANLKFPAMNRVTCVGCSGDKSNPGFSMAALKSTAMPPPSAVMVQFGGAAISVKSPASISKRMPSSRST